MLRTMIWFIWFGISLFITLPFLICVKILDKQNRAEQRLKLVHKVTVVWAKSLVNLSGAKIKVTGIENLPTEGPVVFISNHQSNFDIPILLGFIDKPKAFISKIEVLKIPVVASWMRQMRCVFMDRKDIRQSVGAINTGVEYLKQGYSMVIFPEGTRSSGKDMGEFKQGSFKLALKSGVPIIPIAINGSYNIMGKGSVLIKPAKVEVKVLPPVKTEKLTREETQSLPGRVYEMIKMNVKQSE